MSKHAALVAVIWTADVIMWAFVVHLYSTL